MKQLLSLFIRHQIDSCARRGGCQAEEESQDGARVSASERQAMLALPAARTEEVATLGVSIWTLLSSLIRVPAQR